MANGPPYALITGCSSGIGQELAIAFAQKGVTVFATARKVESLHGLTTKYPNIEALSVELADSTSIEKLGEAITKRTGGRLDYLVNNAGAQYQTMCLDADIAKVEEMYQVNLFAVMRMCQLFVPLLRMAPRGRIVQIGSVTRGVPLVNQAPYNASKAALSQYSNTLRLELQPFGVEVIEIVTAFVRSNILHKGFNMPENSLYQPIRAVVEAYKRNGNATGTPTDQYARSVVDQVTCARPAMEVWEGRLALRLWFLLTFLPMRATNWIMFRMLKLHLLNSPKTE